MPAAKHVDHHYFDVLNPRSAWILGFWTADGCAYQRKKTYVISFAQTGRELLSTVKKELRSEHKIGFTESNNAAVLQFCSKEMYWSLCSLFGSDNLQRKSNTIRYPWGLPNNLFWHFLRGLMDGDGCYRFTNGQPQAILTSGSIALLRDIQWHIMIRTGINMSIQKKSLSGYNMRCFGVNACILTSLLYLNAELYSRRKRQDADRVLAWKIKRRPRNISAITKRAYSELIKIFLHKGVLLFA